VQEILESDRNAVQRTQALTRAQRAVGQLSGAARFSFIYLDESVKPGVVALDPLKIAFKKAGGRRFAGAKAFT
jgi:hypothetical protein